VTKGKEKQPDFKFYVLNLTIHISAVADMVHDNLQMGFIDAKNNTVFPNPDPPKLFCSG
jgi:hypothetical protein